MDEIETGFIECHKLIVIETFQHITDRFNIKRA